MAGINAERDIWKHLMEVMDRVDSLEQRLKKERINHVAEIRRLKEDQQKALKEERRMHGEEIRALKAQLAGLTEENQKLREEVTRLKSQLEKDSHNSSLPPSRDQRPSVPANEPEEAEHPSEPGKVPNVYNSRQKTGRKSGGQKGHTGRTRLLQETLERIQSLGVEVRKDPENSAENPTRECKECLVLDIATSVDAQLKRFYPDNDGNYHIPPEYRSQVVYGQKVQSLVLLLYGQGVQSAARIVELISAITGDAIKLSQGTVFNWLERFHTRSIPELKKIENHLLNQEQVSTDGTNVTVNGQQTYIRNFSVRDWALYVPMKRKNLDCLGQIPFLRKFTGILTHDHETALYHFGMGHSECNVHLIRYLTANSENTGHCWSSKLRSLLAEMNRYRKRLIAQGKDQVPAACLLHLEQRFDELLSFAEEEQKRKPCSLRWAQKEESALLNRLKKYKQNHLLFLHDFRVPFDNNMSERDLRKCKNRQKMTGGFRTSHGQEIFCSLLSITVPQHQSQCADKGNADLDRVLQHTDVVLLDGVRVVGQRGEIARAVLSGEGLNAFFHQPVKGVFAVLLHRPGTESGEERPVERPGDQHQRKADARDEQQRAEAERGIAGDQIGYSLDGP